VAAHAAGNQWNLGAELRDRITQDIATALEVRLTLGDDTRTSMPS
jgi:hypothetical protein